MTESYSPEGYEYIRQKIEDLAKLLGDHPMKAVRPTYVRWTVNLATQLKMSPKATQLALSYIEIYLKATVPFPADEIQTVCSAAVALALSFEHARVLAPSKLFELTSLSLTPEELCHTQLEVFTALGYNCDIPTATDCLGLLLSQSGDFDPEECRVIEKLCAELYQLDTIFQRGPCCIALAALINYSQSRKSHSTLRKVREAATLYFEMELEEVQHSLRNLDGAWNILN